MFDEDLIENGAFVMSKRKGPKEPVVGECVYCGRIKELDKDHVPPENLFPKPKPSSLIKIPSCIPCNRGFSKDDEYFRTAIALTLDTRRDPRTKQIVDKSLSSLKRPNGGGYKSLFFSSMHRVEMRGTTGLYYGTTLAFSADLVRVRRYANRIIRGLYFHEIGIRLPTNAGVQSVVDGVLPDPDWMALLESQRAKDIGEGIFSYRYLIAQDEPLASAWLLIFFGKLQVCGLTLPEVPRVLPNRELPPWPS